MQEYNITPLWQEMFFEIEKRVPNKLKNKIITMKRSADDEIWKMNFYGSNATEEYAKMPKPKFIGNEVITVIDYIKYWCDNYNTIGLKLNKEEIEDYECITNVLSEVIDEYKAKYKDFDLRYDDDRYHYKMERMKGDFDIQLNIPPADGIISENDEQETNAFFEKLKDL